VTNITFTFETAPNTKPKQKKVGGHRILCPPVWKSGGTRPRVPHQIAPMRTLNEILMRAANLIAYFDLDKINLAW